MALAPWTTPQCVLSYLEAARDIANGFIFYLPDTGAGIPPPVNNPVWGLNDGGSWKSQNKYPVYAIPGTTGGVIMTQLGMYSGNLNQSTNSTLLQPQALNNNRMYAIVDTAGNSNLPSLWAFLLIVLGIVLLLIGVTSGFMHLYQRRRRIALQRRIANGEVDLELLGIKRLTVPQEAIDKLPQLTYMDPEKGGIDVLNDHGTASSGLAPKGPSSTNTAGQGRRSVSEPIQPASPLTPRSPITPQLTSPPHQKGYSQPVCPICLDDFIHSSTTVRSLPCSHIYHPECIDTFLRENSSLCPVCKAKVLPNGYCPETITNAMVRHERQQRRNRERIRRFRGDEAANQVPVASRVEPDGFEGFRDRVVAVHGRMATFHRQFGNARGSRSASVRAVSAPIATETEMRNMNGQPEPPPPSSSPEQQQQQQRQSVVAAPRSPTAGASMSRAERARRRASALLGHQATVEDEEHAQWARLPRCKLPLVSFLEPLR